MRWLPSVGMTDTVAVAIPGMFGSFVPSLTYASDAAQARGARTVAVTWTGPENPVELPQADLGPWVCQQVRPVLDELPRATKPLLIGKSLGTHAAALAAERDLPAIWITPLLTFEFVADALRRATAPCLLVGGTGDTTWDGSLARQLSSHALEFDGADHGLYVPGPLAASAAVLGQFATAVEHFLDQTVWPSRSRERP